MLQQIGDAGGVDIPPGHETQGGEDTAPEAETPPEEADGEVIEVNPLQPLLDL